MRRRRLGRCTPRPACASASRTTSKKPKSPRKTSVSGLPELSGPVGEPRLAALRPRRGFSFLPGLVLVALALSARAGPVPAPKRIVALAPSCAEILYALGAAARVVGVSDFAKDLPGSAGKTLVGGFA